jgi:hypothetical protein
MAIAAVLLSAGQLAAAESSPQPTDLTTGLSQEELLQAILRASATEEVEELQRREQALQREIDELVQRLGRRAPSYRRARKLHNVLHREYLRHYDADADNLNGIVHLGRYNCVSGVLFYGLVARALGYRPQVLAYPGHVLLRITVKERKIDVETTSPYGYDVGWLLHPSRHAGREEWLHPDVRQQPTESHRYGEHGGSVWLVPLDAAVGFAWINEAWRSLEQGEAVPAGEQVLEAKRYLPDLARAEGVRRLLVLAFRQEYEAGRFDSAYRIAEIDVGLFPDSTTSRDRIVAAAMKRIEAACAAGVPQVGTSILDEVKRTCPATGELSKLELQTTPIIAAAAVRSGDWPLARRAAERYAAVEPDPIEGARLLDWVELRSSTDLQLSDPDSCVDLLSGFHALSDDR